MLENIYQNLNSLIYVNYIKISGALSVDVYTKKNEGITNAIYCTYKICGNKRKWVSKQVLSNKKGKKQL